MKPIFSPSSISLQVWPNITERFYIKELSEARNANSEEAQAALPCLETSPSSPPGSFALLATMTLLALLVKKEVITFLAVIVTEIMNVL